MPETLELMIACNDPDNGNFQHYVDAVDVYDADGALMQLRGGRVWCRITSRHSSYKPRKIRLGHITVNVLGYTTWVGNWCWDCATVSREDAARVVNYLQRRGWNCEEAAVHLFSLFDAGTLITANDLTWQKSEAA